MAIPHVTAGDWPEIRGDRFARGVSRDAEPPAGAAIALLGLPSDVGAALNRGRVGAARGPAAFRAALGAYGAAWDGEEGKALETLVWDAGDLVPAEGSDAAALRATHARALEACRALHDRGLVVVCIGGTHDLTWPAVRALSEAAGKPVGGINVDAHLDVRDPATEFGSGMPFRGLIEGGHLDPHRFVEFGVSRFANSRQHWEWAKERGVTIVGVEKAMDHRSAVPTAFERFSRAALRDAGRIEPGFVSIDLDAIDGSQAPGVSAVNPSGLSVAEAARAARRAGAHPAVRHFDLMELNPVHDDPPPERGVGRTARAAALLFLSFVAGFAERPR